MGTTHHHHYHQTDPATQAQLTKLRKEAQNQKDPKMVAISMQKCKEVIWNWLKTEKFVKQCKQKTVIFAGRTDVGKSSLLNSLFSSKFTKPLPTSKGSCTKEIQMVLRTQKVCVFDCPGFDTHFDIVKNPLAIPAYLGAMDDIYYLYNGEIEEDIIKTCLAMRKNVYAIRTKCDEVEITDEAVKKSDQEKLRKMGVPKPLVFFTSKKGGVDNAKVMAHIMS